MKNKKKILAALFAMAVLAGAVSCSKGGAGTGSTGSRETGGSGTSDGFDLLPDKKWNGAEYSVLNAELASIEGALGADFESDDSAVSPIPASVYRRNMAVEERFGVKITHFPTQSLYDVLSSTVGSGDLDYHAVYGDYNSMSNLSAGKYLMNLRDIPHIDFTAPWWNQAAQDSLTVGGRQYLAINDVPYSTLVTSHCMYFNKSIASENQGTVGNPYDYVFDGTWTIDKLITTSRGIAKDNGDSVWNEEDLYGVTFPIGSLTMLGVAFGESVYPVKIADGEIVETDEAKWADMISKIYTLCYDNENGTYVGSHVSETPMTMFTQSKSLYYIGALCDAPMYFRGMEDDFGILPLPKYNEKQEEYRTPLSGASLMLGVSTLPDKDALEFIGIITEAMAIKSHELLRSAVYETVFENQLTRDEESKKTMTLIVNGLYADFVFVHAAGVGGGYYGEIHMLMDQKSDAYASARRRNKTRVENYYKGILDIYKGLDD